MSSRWLTDRPLRIDQKHVECFRRCLVRIQEGVARIISASAGDHPPTWFLLADHLPEKDGHALAESGLALLGIPRRRPRHASTRAGRAGLLRVGRPYLW